MTKIYKRLIFNQITKYLDGHDIVVLHGARQVGKTSILQYLQDYLKNAGEPVHYIDLEDSRLARILDEGVEEFMKYLEEEGLEVKKKLYVLIDEIQYLADPSSFLKLAADHYKHIRLIVSGSSSFNIKAKFKDSLAGRTVNFEIYPLSFEEFLLFKNYHFERQKVFTSKKIQELTAFYEEYTLYGSYPKIVLTPEVEKKEKYLQQIIDTYVKKDVRDLANIKDVHKFNRLLELLASQGSQLLNVAEASNTLGIAKQTLEHYLFLLEQTYIVRLLRPFSRNVRSELTKTPKIFFYDTGLMQMLWLKELPKKILGQVFETSVFAELIKIYGAEKIFHWRTADKKEIDFILQKAGATVPLEAKMNFQQARVKAINYFLEKYNLRNFSVVGLYGKKSTRGFVYPWEM